MVIVPKGKPLMVNSSYYLDVKRLIEYCRRELISGCMHLKSRTAQGVIYFDKDNLLTGIFQDTQEEFEGDSAIGRILEIVAVDEFMISVYRIDQRIVSFWVRMASAEEVHMNWIKDLTHVEEMIRKFRSEKLTGYFDISINNGKEGGLLFFDSSQFIGGSYSWGNGKLDNSKESQNLLIQKALESGGTFRVMKLPLEKLDGKGTSTQLRSGTSPRVIEMLEELIVILDRTVSADKKPRSEFRILFKRTLLEKAGKYHFLDPFAEKSIFFDRALTSVGDATAEELAAAIVECVTELADERGLFDQFMKNLKGWAKKYPEEVARLDIRFRT